MKEYLLKKKKILIITAIAVICVIALGYWIDGLFYVSTDDAYVNANVVQIAPRVTGQVQTLYVTPNQYVKEGQALFDLDPATYITTLNEYKGLEAYSAAKVKITKITSEREASLVKTHAASREDGDTAEANYLSSVGAVQGAQAAVAQAQLNLEYTKVTAPTSGWITNLSLRVGDVIPANQPVFALVSDNEYWIDANFEESQLEDIKPGQNVDVIVDMYPSHHFKGTVESISNGSGNAFSLLPPENATGNWVKITQRIPVRIHIVDPDPKYPLRIGSSSKVNIRLHPFGS